MKRIVFTLMLGIFLPILSIAQVAVTTDGSSPNSNAMLEIKSTNKGLLPPRIALTSTSSASPLSSHVEGMMVYNTATAGDVTPGFYYNNGTAWVRLSGGSSSSSQWDTSGSDIYYNTGNVGIGTTTPNSSAALDVNSSSKGFLVPRMTETQCTFMDTPVAGMVIYNTTVWCLQVYNGTEWISLCENSGAPNYAPVASNVVIAGTPANGSTLTGSYDYYDANGDVQGTSTLMWLRADNASGLNMMVIGGATSSTYVLTSSDVGKYVAFKVTPVATTGHSPGQAVISSYSGPVVLGSIATLNCASATNNGTLINGVAAGSVSSVIAYTGGNSGSHSGQVVSSTGVTGLTATLAAGNFASGSGTLTYTITGTPTSAGTASFAVNIGGQSCTLSRTVAAGSITTLDCAGATNNGALVNGAASGSVSSVIAYTGGNGGSHSGQVVSSTGVTGLTATLAAGNFASGAGSLTYTITGTPTGSGGTASFVINIGGQSCTLSRTVAAASIATIDCAGATNNGTLNNGAAANGVSSVISYTGGNGGSHSGQVVSSTGVTGLTATLTAGNFASGAGTLTYTITGTPTNGGTASFAINIGGQSCTLTRTVISSVIVDVTNATTGKTWMDRNLGASQAATSSTDTSAYGYLYQWGRGTDGHQLRTSSTTSTLSSSDTPGHGNFILSASIPYDWRSPQNTNLWQGVSGVNNPCPSGYRLPTNTELDAECASWSSQNAAGAFASVLKLPLAGYRSYSTGSLNYTYGSFYWSSTLNQFWTAYGTYFSAKVLVFKDDYLSISSPFHYANGCSVRCIKDDSTGSITTLNCAGATNHGILTNGVAADSVSSVIAYTGGNGGSHSGQTVTSTGVTGLTATLAAGNFANGAGSLTYTITGTPTGSGGTASFAINIGGQSCTLTRTVGAIAIVDVTNATTGKTWMDRNLGASQAATSSTDASAYGDLYQWGRGTDGHQIRTSTTTSTLSSSDSPGHGSFILSASSPYDWRSPQNINLWQGVSGVNNPCPTGYRLPTETELDAERASWSTQNAAGAFASVLKLPLAGYRHNSTGSLMDMGTLGGCWSSTNSGIYSRSLSLSSSSVNMINEYRTTGLSVRCIKNDGTGSISSLDCSGATNSGTLTNGVAASGVSSVIAYTGGDGGSHNGQVVNSTGVTGLTATLTAGNFASGAGTLTYAITGTPTSSGNASFAINIGGQSCTLSRTVAAGSITTLDCAGATNNGTLTKNVAASSVSSVIAYTGGNGGSHSGQVVTSTGVTGLTATLAAGNFASGAGSLTYTITGTPGGVVGTASFAINIGGQSCTLNRVVNSSVIVDVTNATTGKTWMDRNLGAIQAATSSTTEYAYGDLYQWGRGTDGHQIRTSTTSSTLSSSDTPGHGNFILSASSPYDWRSPQNTNLWQGVSGVNNPCPSGYRLPTETELDAERASWSTQNAAGAFASVLKLPLAGYRHNSTGSLMDMGTLGGCWSSTNSGIYSRSLSLSSSSVNMINEYRTTGLSVRCIKDYGSDSISSIDCAGATNNGTLANGVTASSVSSVIAYTGGGGSFHSGQTVTSTGVTGLTAALPAENFASGAGSLTYTITGTPTSSGTASFAINIGGQTCTLLRTVVAAGSISSIDCAGATNNGFLSIGVAASSVSSVIAYTGGDGGLHNGQVVNSTGVTGLTATLAAGNFASGAGSLTYTITGTPASSGTASFAINIGGQTCTLTRAVFHTAIVDVTSPSTGRTWMDRNLGASQAATSSTDASAYGDLYQWGRGTDGHQLRASSTTSTLSGGDTPGHGNFITNTNSPYDWRSTQNNNLWQGVNGTNNPCPSGYRLPTNMELDAERAHWSSQNAAGAYASVLKLPMTGYRVYTGSISDVGTGSYSWSSTVSYNSKSYYLYFSSSEASTSTTFRAFGVSVRCIKNW